MTNTDNKTAEISTTDKLKMYKALKEKGFRVELNSDSVPTVICKNAQDIKSELAKVRKVIKECRYVGSFGVRGPRKSDGEIADFAEDKKNSVTNTEISESADNENIEQVAG